MYIKYKKEGKIFIEFLKTLTTYERVVIDDESHKLFMETLLNDKKENRSLLKTNVIYVIQFNDHQIRYKTLEDCDADFNRITLSLEYGKEMFTILGDIENIRI